MNFKKSSFSRITYCEQLRLSFLVFILVPKVIQPIAEHYKANVEDLTLELRQTKRMIELKTIGGTMPSFADSPLLEFAKFASKYTDAFLN